MKLKGKVALITGGARGIGQAVALAYAREGNQAGDLRAQAIGINMTVQRFKD